MPPALRQVATRVFKKHGYSLQVEAYKFLEEAIKSYNVPDVEVVGTLETIINALKNSGKTVSSGWPLDSASED